MTLYQEPNLPGIFTQDIEEIREFDKNLISELGGMSSKLKSILDRGISFDDNVDVRRVSVTSHATPGTEFSVAHGLGKTPTDYIKMGQGGAGTVYDGTTANDATTLYLRSDASSVAFRLMVF